MREVSDVPRRLRGQHFVKEAAFLDIAGEDFSFVDVLVANRGREIFPARIFRIGRRIIRIWRDVAGAAGHTDTIRTNELVVVVVGRIVHEPIAVPFFARFVVEIRIREQAEAEHAGGFAINFLVDPGWLRLGLLIQPQAKFIRFGRGAKPRFVHQRPKS